MLDSFLNVFLKLIVTLLYYQYYYLFCYFISFYCFIIIVLITLSELFCVIISHRFSSWVALLLTLDNFVYLLIFYLTLYKALPCSKSVYTHIIRCNLCCFYVPLLTLNDLMPYYCFSHYFNDKCI